MPTDFRPGSFSLDSGFAFRGWAGFGRWSLPGPGSVGLPAGVSLGLGLWLFAIDLNVGEKHRPTWLPNRIVLESNEVKISLRLRDKLD